MKKVVAIILSLAMLLSCAACFAEAAEAAEVAEVAEKEELGTVNVNGVFKIQGRIPEGYRLSFLNQNPMYIRCKLISESKEKPGVELTIAYAEDWADTERLNDVSEADLLEIEESFREEDEVNIEYRTTAYGTKVMVVTEALEETDFVAVYTIYKGYELEFVMTPGSNPLTEENTQMLVDFISEMDFVEA